jgi:hypothetical protein
LNRLGKLYRHYDEAGLQSFPAYDFKGNVLEKTRQVIGDGPILAVFDAAPEDWVASPLMPHAIGIGRWDAQFTQLDAA